MKIVFKSYKDYNAYFEGGGGYHWWNGSMEPGRIRDEGWKLHIGATQANAQAIADAVLPLLVTGKVAHKLLPDTDMLVDAATQKGKFIAIYPLDLENAFAVVGVLDANARLRAFAPTHAPGERVVGRNGFVTARYGGFNDDVVMKNGKPTRYAGREQICPEWVADPWNHYPNIAAAGHIAPWPSHS